MKDSFRFALISLIAFSITYSLTLFIQNELITNAVIISFLLQWVLFFPAYFYQTEKFYDISGSINYILIVSYIYINNYITSGFNIGNLVLSFLIFIWAIRLGMFLFLRIQKDGEDKRFGSIKPSATKFFMTWTIQATWVSICSLCALTGISSNSGVVINNLFFLGLTFFIVGFFIEVVADIQKTKFRKNPKNKNNFITTGLWAYSRHPNYLGEISIWTGISIISFSSLSNLQYVTLISPIFTYVLLVYVSGVNLLEESGNKKWGHLKSYKEYIQKTPRLLF
ncbi:DUF1295 domain-containing protein [Flavobacteriaceae bacterium]|nr:DUF1295 domain-containing protein [Flavobacteriaceae bacterium]